MKTSIIVLCYNSSKYIGKLVESIYEYNDSDTIEIIVADNASTDDTVSEIKKLKNRVKFVDNGENYGFAKGINLASKHATGDYLLFVNPDTRWQKGTVADLVSVMESRVSIGIVGGKLLDKNGVNEKSAGRFFGLIAGVLIAFGLDDKFGVRFSPDRTQKVDFVSGGFMMIRSSLFKKLLGFDEKFFMYVEDMELCFRAKMGEYTTYFTPDAELFHEAHASGSRGFAIQNIIKGILYFHKKHGTLFSYFILKTLFMLKAVVLVSAGKLLNNKYLSETYSQALII